MSLQLEDFLSSEIITILSSFRKNIYWKKQFHSECGPCDIRNPKSAGQQICGGAENQNKILHKSCHGSFMMDIKALLSKSLLVCNTNEYPKMRRHSDLKSTITIQLYTSPFLREKQTPIPINNQSVKYTGLELYSGRVT